MGKEKKPSDGGQWRVILLSFGIAILFVYIIYRHYYPQKDSNVTESHFETDFEQEEVFNYVADSEIQAKEITSPQKDLPAETFRASSDALDHEITTAKRLNQQLATEIDRMRKLNSQLESKLAELRKSNGKAADYPSNDSVDKEYVERLAGDLDETKKQSSRLEARVSKLEKSLSTPASSTVTPTSDPTQKTEPDKVYVEVTGKKGKVMLYEGMGRTEALQLMGNPDEIIGSGSFKMYAYNKSGENYPNYILCFYNDKLESISQ